MVSPNNFGSVNFFRENPHHLVSAVYAPDPCGYTENGQKRQ